ncbi:NAD(P)-binding protein [Chelatococcus reniformis]|uniref:Amine oxidase domain-containing protein n=1 Tax=Chelatococcus reniformis TaxID=1494448 RepID=A0A916X9E0_9HYPH|nr:NAD(P)-binding protein [Chelatococcus reniformis]GGC54494.1 hypothetical protein GCM10010994_11820 [Chelatococcus reniformis]
MTRQRIAIVGGGMAALTAAFELTQRAEQRERFDITIYQMGWRLGGKGATGRDERGRVVEHGLHIWFGCYENAFRMLRAAYEEWEPLADQKIVCSDDALKPQCNSAIGAGDRPEIIGLRWPSIDGTPGVSAPDLTAFSSFSQMLHVMQEFFRQLAPPGEFADSLPPDPILGTTTIALLRLAGVDASKYATSASAEAGRGERSLAIQAERVLELASDWAGMLAANDRLRNEAQLRAFISVIRSFARAALDTEAFVKRPSGNFLAQLIDVGTAAIKGVVVDMMLGGATVGDLDLMDFREWLAVCGADRSSIYGSPIVQALYDSMLQYCEGDKRRPSYGAGTATQAVIRLYGTYRGAFAFEMQSGMGEVVVVPIYEVLKRRGVKFQFFMKMNRIALDPSKTAVEWIEFDRQVNLISGEYIPTIAPGPGNGFLQSWPSRPLWDQIHCGEQLATQNIDLESHWCTHSVGKVMLRQGREFDNVILAVPLGAFKKLNAAPGPCDALIEANAQFRAMTETATLVPSISVQAWCSVPTAGFRWPPEGAVPPDAPEKTVISTGPDPLGIWADMSQVLQFEPYGSGPVGPESLQYLCDAFACELYRAPPEEGHVPADAKARARSEAIDWFSRKARCIWPGTSPHGYFDWTVLFDPDGAAGSDRIDAQVCQANVDPSSCCVASAAGSTRWRLATDASGFGHLYLAGAWIDSGFNTECIETAVISGMQAARAISGTSFAIPGEDFLRFGDGLPAPLSLVAEGAMLLWEALVDAAWEGSAPSSVGGMPRHPP